MKRDFIFLKEFRNGEHLMEVGNILDADLDDVTTKGGVYIIISDSQKFVYPNGQSKVIYIGKANNLRRRLKEHRKHLCDIEEKDWDEIWHFDRYNYMHEFGANVYYYTHRGLQDDKNLESQIIEAFYDRYHAMPVGNGARSFRVSTK